MYSPIIVGPDEPTLKKIRDVVAGQMSRPVALPRDEDVAAVTTVVAGMMSQPVVTRKPCSRCRRVLTGEDAAPGAFVCYRCTALDASPLFHPRYEVFR